MAITDSMTGALREPDFPNYEKEYRGLPAEIRLMIWRYALCDELHVNIPPDDSDTKQHAAVHAKPSESWSTLNTKSCGSLANFCRGCVYRPIHVQLQHLLAGQADQSRSDDCFRGHCKVDFQ